MILFSYYFNNSSNVRFYGTLSSLNTSNVILLQLFLESQSYTGNSKFSFVKTNKKKRKKLEIMYSKALFYF